MADGATIGEHRVVQRRDGTYECQRCQRREPYVAAFERFRCIPIPDQPYPGYSEPYQGFSHRDAAREAQRGGRDD